MYLQYLKKIEKTKNSRKIIEHVRKSLKSCRIIGNNKKHIKFKKTKGNVAIMGNLKKHPNYIWKHVKIIETNGPFWI